MFEWRNCLNKEIEFNNSNCNGQSTTIRNIEAILVKIQAVQVNFQSEAYRKLGWSVLPNKTNESSKKFRGSEEQTSNFRGSLPHFKL